jgi:hypothetical protein
MSPLSKPPPPDALDITSAEEHMRRVLGLTGDRAARDSPPRTERPQASPPGRPAGRAPADKLRHRFVQDGAVPVTVISRHRPDEADALSASRAATEAALQDERAARAKAERALQEALATVRDLQTKLGHAELAHREALGTAQTARAEVDTLRAEHGEQALRWREDLAAERAARAAAEAALAEAANARGPAARTRPSASAAQPLLDLPDASPLPEAAPPAKAVAKRARKAAQPRQREPEPVKWWLQSARKRWP